MYACIFVCVCVCACVCVCVRERMSVCSCWNVWMHICSVHASTYARTRVGVRVYVWRVPILSHPSLVREINYLSHFEPSTIFLCYLAMREGEAHHNLLLFLRENTNLEETARHPLVGIGDDDAFETVKKPKSKGVYVCVHVCVRECVYVHVCILVWESICMRVYVCVCVCVCVCVYSRMCACTRVCMCAFISVS
jgi:hypothetical protein